MPKVAAVPRGILVIRVLREDRLECVGGLPALQSCARILGELLSGA